MKKIVCFGDSNTWGYNPADGTRFPPEIRWPRVLGNLLGDDYEIIEEGQNGRTICCEDPWEWGDKKGIDYIIPMVETHHPFDLLIIMLGSNDLKAKFHLPAGDIAGGLQNMLMRTISFLNVKCHASPKILVVAPPALKPGIAEGVFKEFFEGDISVTKSKDLAKWYKLVADQFEVDFLDASLYAEVGDTDSLHLTEPGHKALAEALAGKVREIL